MDISTDFGDLQDILDTLRGSVPDSRGVWCTPSLSFETKVTRKRGIILGGAWSPQFLRWTEAPFSVPFTKLLIYPHVLLAETVVGSLRDWMPFFEQIAKRGSLLVVTERINDALLQTFIVNAVKDSMNACVVRLEGSIADRSIAFGKPFTDPPQDFTLLPVVSEAWVRRNATVVFPEAPQDCQSVTEDITIIEVGGEDFDDQQARLRLLSDTIRRSEWLTA